MWIWKEKEAKKEENDNFYLFCALIKEGTNQQDKAITEFHPVKWISDVTVKPVKKSVNN